MFSKASFLGKASIYFILLIGISSNSNASLLYSSLHDYGNGLGAYNPGGNDILSTDKVSVSDQSTSRFNDAFDLSSITGVIDRIELTLTYDNAGPRGFGLLEAWSVRAQGSNSGMNTDDDFSLLTDDLSPLTIIYDASSDNLLIDVFAHSVSTKNFEFWFSEFSLSTDVFDLNSASIEVYGSPVPVPAALPLFTLGLAGISLFRRKKIALKSIS